MLRFSRSGTGRAPLALLIAALLLGAGAPTLTHAQQQTDAPPRQDDGDSQAARFRLAQRYLDADKAERGIALLENLHSESPSTRAFYQKLLSAYESQKRYEDAIALVEQRMQRNGRSPALLSAKARLQYHGDAGEETAFATWDEALAAAPERAQTYRTVFGTLTDARLFQQAIEALKKGRSVLDNPALMRLQMAHLYNLTSQHEKAIGEYLKMLRENPDRLALVKRRLGRFLDQGQALTESIAATSRAVRSEPMRRPYRELMGWLYLQADEHRKALDAYRAIDRLEEANGRALDSFAEQAAEAGAYRAALRAYEIVLERHPEAPVAPDARRGLGRMHERRAASLDNAPAQREKHYEQALAAYRTFLDKHPRHEAYPDVLRAVGRIQQDVLFELSAAEETLQNVAERYPQTEAARRAQYDLGRLRIMRGDLTEARLAFSRLTDRLDGGDLAQQARYQQALLQFYEGAFDAAGTILGALAKSTEADVSNDGIELGVLLAESAASRDTTDQALSLFAKARLKHRQRQGAETLALLDELLQSHARSPLADDARFFKARALAEQDRPADAADAFAQVALTHPKSPLAGRSLYRAARLRETALDDPEAALHTYQRLLRDYPGSLRAADARERIRALQRAAKDATGPAS